MFILLVKKVGSRIIHSTDVLVSGQQKKTKNTDIVLRTRPRDVFVIIGLLSTCYLDINKFNMVHNQLFRTCG